MLRGQKGWKLAVALALVGLLVAGTSRAADEAGELDPRVKTTLEEMARYVSGLKAFGVDIATTMVIQNMGSKTTVKQTANVRVERPNRLAITSHSDLPSLNVVCDGEHLWMYLPLGNKYSEGEAPKNFAQLIEEQPIVLASTGMSGALLVALLSDAPVEKVLEGITNGEYVGEDEIDDIKCHHLRVNQNEISVDFWIATGKEPMVVRMVPDLAAAVAKQFPGEAGAQLKIDATVRFENFRSDPKFGEKDFAFTPAEGAEKTDSLFNQEPAEDAAHALVGQPAPALKLPALDGRTVDLASHRGRDVVILDFWATWCGPCRKAMPTITSVAKEFRKQGVVFYAVNLQEDADTVKEFLRGEKLELPVLLDFDGKVAQAYKAEAIPQTVIVGKDGTVQVVHVGLLPDLEKQLRQELTDLVAGKNLAAKATDEAKDASPATATDDGDAAQK